ncbi:MAG TPA: purine-nucleoside phosphorylase [Anaerolineales bacterium]|nr:purine-nucleoside phosphorylase [Anaerolineales bacterium]
MLTTAQLQEIAGAIRARTQHRPTIGLILGSGLGSLANEISHADVIPYTDLPHWPPSTVHGHSGQLVIGNLEGQVVLAMQGRIHFYEGYTMQQITMPVRVMALLGISTLIVTNAAGGINRAFEVGDPMLIVDHINFLGMVGMNPLMGPNLDEFGPRFPAMANAYDRDLGELARQVAQANGINLREGVYCALSGPFYETPAELRFLQVIGADAVGMSTAPEVVVARHNGMRSLGISGITNVCDLTGDSPANHEEVIEAGKVLVPRLTKILRGVLAQMPQ